MQNIPKKLICLILAIALAAGLAGCASKEVRDAYRMGEAAMNAGRYADAADYFGPLEGYKDSELYLDTIYFEAMNLLEAGTYPEAAGVFEVLARYDIQDAAFFARIAGAYDCLYALDAVGAYALLEGTDRTRPEAAAVYAALELFCFEDTMLIRPEYVAEELVSGKVTPEVTNAAEDPYLDIMVYAMTSHITDSVYTQYREYCMRAFPDSFQEESNNYFTIQIEGQTYYICNFHALYGGLVIKIPRY